MANNAPEPRTDSFKAATDKLTSNPDPTPRVGVVNKRAAGIAIAVALLGGTGFTATRMKGDGTPVTPVPDPQPAATDTTAATGTTATANTPATAPAPAATLAHGNTHPVQGGTIHPNEKVDIAHSVNDKMSFAEAFETARDEVGTEGVFSWHGRVYNTFTQTEWRGLSLADRQAFLQDVGYKPTTTITGPSNDPTEPQRVEVLVRVVNETDGKTKNDEPQPPDGPYLIQTTINGMPAIGSDDDGDGIVDQLIVFNPEEGTVFALLDTEGNNGLDIIAQLNPETFEVEETAPLDTPYELSVDELERYVDPALDYVDEPTDDDKPTGSVDPTGEEEPTTDPTHGTESDDNDDSAMNKEDYNNNADVSGMA